MTVYNNPLRDLVSAGADESSGAVPSTRMSTIIGIELTADRLSARL
jgi:hypothetical protein